MAKNNITECVSCKAKIVFGLSNGKRIPINFESISYLPHSETLVYDPKKGHITHFATCPDALRFRRREKRIAPAATVKPRARSEKLIDDRERLLNLVRYCRHQLHERALITDQEFADLMVAGSAAKLASYAPAVSVESRARSENEWEDKYRKEVIIREELDRNAKAEIDRLTMELARHIKLLQDQEQRHKEETANLRMDIEEQAAHAFDCGAEAARNGIQELQFPDDSTELFDRIPEECLETENGTLFCRFHFCHDPGDRSVGLDPSSWWELSADQAGTVLKKIIDRIGA